MNYLAGKTMAVALSAVLFATVSYGQLYKQDVLLNLGVSSGYGYPNKLTSTENSGIPTVNLGAEFVLHPMISAGFYTAYTYSFYKFNGPSEYKDVWKGWDIGIRANVHLGPVIFSNKKADLYIGSFAGYVNRTMQYDKSNIYRTSLDYKINTFCAGGLAGFSYRVGKKIGLYGEAGVSRKFFIGGGASYKIFSRSKE